MQNGAESRRVAIIDRCVMTTLGLQHLFFRYSEWVYQFAFFRDSKAWFSNAGRHPYDIVIYSVTGSRTSRQQCFHFLSSLAHTRPDTLRVLLAENERQANFILPLLPVTLHAVLCQSSSLETLGAQINALTRQDHGQVLHQPSGSPGLSPTERRILHSMGKGYSLADIAAGLGRNTKTIYTHKCNVMSKLGVKSDAWLLCAADILCALPPPPARRRGKWAYSQTSIQVASVSSASRVGESRTALWMAPAAGRTSSKARKETSQ